jgi:hypothetical protein
MKYKLYISDFLRTSVTVFGFHVGTMKNITRKSIWPRMMIFRPTKRTLIESLISRPGTIQLGTIQKEYWFSCLSDFTAHFLVWVQRHFRDVSSIIIEDCIFIHHSFSILWWSIEFTFKNSLKFLHIIVFILFTGMLVMIASTVNGYYTSLQINCSRLRKNCSITKIITTFSTWSVTRRWRCFTDSMFGVMD